MIPSLKNEYITLKIEQRLYQCPVPIIGLTGGIATGKSFFARYLSQRGLPVISADDLIKNIYDWPETKDWLLKNNLPPKGPKLREMVFNDPDLKIKVENYLYPLLPKSFLDFFSRFKNPQVIIYDVPLLFEKKLELFFDQVVLVYASKDEQIKRLIQRDHISNELALKMLQSQLPIENKKTKTKWVIDNNDILNSKDRFDQFFDLFFTGI
jgi:dephospho-CoA kinase